MESPAQVLASFQTYLKESAAQLLATGAAACEYKGDDGTTAIGWIFDHRDRKLEEIYNLKANPVYRGGTWGHSEYLLSKTALGT
jgi:hypothetical protein